MLLVLVKRNYCVSLEVIYQKLFQERQQIFLINKKFKYLHKEIKKLFELFRLFIKPGILEVGIKYRKYKELG